MARALQHAQLAVRPRQALDDPPGQGDRHERVVRAVDVQQRQVAEVWAFGDRLVGGDERFERRPFPPAMPHERIGEKVGCLQRFE